MKGMVINMTEIFKTVLNMSITGAYIAAAIMLLRLPMKKLPKKYSYALWSILGIRLICPFSFSAAVSLFNIIRPENDGNRMTYIPDNIEYASEPRVTVSVPVVNEAINNSLPAAEPNNSMNPMQAAIGICAAVWITGAVIMLIYTAYSCIRIRKIVSGSKHLTDNIYVCRNIESPFVYGIIKPRIFVPEGVSESDMQYISAHEKTHIKRGDHIIKPAAMLALCLHWFNPLIWISYRLMVKDMELSCDEKAVRSFKEDVRRDYASALLNMSVKQNKLYGMLAFGESDIKTRIKRVLSLKKPRVIATVTAAAVLIIAAVCLLTDAEKNTPFEEFGVYFSEKCIYMTPVSSFFGDDTGEIYDISDNSFTISKRVGNDFKQSFELSEWSDFPYSEEEWGGLFMAGINSVDISGYNKKLYMKLSSVYSLMKMDSELWLVRSYRDGIWSIYSLAPYDENLSANQININGLGSFEITKSGNGYEVRSPETDIYFYFDENTNDELYVRRNIDGAYEETVIPFLFGFDPYNTYLAFEDISGDGTEDIIVITDIKGTGVVGNIASVIDGKNMTEIEIDRLAAEKMISESSVSLLAEEAFNGSDPYITAIMPEMNEKYIYPYYPDKSVRRFGGMYYSYNGEAGTFTCRSFFVFIKDELYFSGTYSADFVFKYEKGRLVPESVSYTLPEKQNSENQTDIAEVKKYEYISPVYHIDEGGYSISPDDASQVRVSLQLPEHWEISGGQSAYIDGNKVFEIGVPYPESEGINYDDFKTDMVMGREITVHEEKYGGAKDGYDYFISKSVPDVYSEDGSYDSYVYVISRNGYRIYLNFVSDSGISRQETDSVLRSVEITPFTEEISYESVTVEADYNADTKELTVTLLNGSDKAVRVWFYTDMLEYLEDDEYVIADALKNSGGAIPRTEIQPGEKYVRTEKYDGLYNMKTGKWRTHMNMSACR